MVIKKSTHFVRTQNAVMSMEKNHKGGMLLVLGHVKLVKDFFRLVSSSLALTADLYLASRSTFEMKGRGGILEEQKEDHIW